MWCWARVSSTFSAATRRSRFSRSARAMSAWRRGSSNSSRQPRSAATSPPLPSPGKAFATGVAGRSYFGMKEQPATRNAASQARALGIGHLSLSALPGDHDEEHGDEQDAEHRRREDAADHG